MIATESLSMNNRLSFRDHEIQTSTEQATYFEKWYIALKCCITSHRLSYVHRRISDIDYSGTEDAI